MGNPSTGLSMAGNIKSLPRFFSCPICSKTSKGFANSQSKKKGFASFWPKKNLFNVRFKALLARVFGFFTLFSLPMVVPNCDRPSSIAPRREPSTFRAQGKHLAEVVESKAYRKVRFYSSNFNMDNEYKRYKNLFSQRKVVLGQDINSISMSYFSF